MDNSWQLEDIHLDHLYNHGYQLLSKREFQFLENYVFGTFDIYITGHNHVLADEGDHKNTLQLISATGALPGGSPAEVDSGKFNIETPGYLKMIVNNNSANYQFVSARDNEILWSNTKLGNGLR